MGLLAQVKRFKKIWREVYFFFPVQILVTHLKKNQILLFFWAIIFSVLLNQFGKNVGLPFLLFDPEYMNDVSFKSTFIIGAAFGIYTISFFITSYILDSHKFAFLATVRYPFIKFCINNSIIPLVFVVIFVIKYIRFQTQSGFESRSEAYLEASGFVLGLLVTVSLILIYFSRTNRSGFEKFANSLDIQFRRKRINAVRVIRKLSEAKKNKFVIHSYLDGFLRFKRVNNNIVIFDRNDLVKIIDQHHLNAIVVEIFLFVSIVALGLFKDYPYFQLPAIASGFLLLSFLTMFTGAFSYWFRGWAISGIIILLIMLNFFTKEGIITSHYEAFGINYSTKKANYSTAHINEINTTERYENDKASTIKILENWKAKFPADTKPKLAFLCVSGGGQRSALWTLHTLQQVDSALQGDLMKHTQLITGASGGLIGASYYRELYLQKQRGKLNDIHKSQYAYNLGKDLLNPMIFSMVVSDFFLRFQQFEYGGYEYSKGRGYAFEQKLNENLNFIFDKKVMDYQEPEYNAEIPMVIMSPTIINDGRKLHISPQKISYMNRATPEIATLEYTRCKGIEFMNFFEDQDAENLRFLSALRMSATFPYVTPNIELPSEPVMEIMDAGLSDNFGITDAIRFISVFEEWIEENTSGIVIVSIRDSENDPEIEKKRTQSLWAKLFNPIGSLYTNWEYIQDFNNENQIEYLKNFIDTKVDYVSFEYMPRPQNWQELKNRNIDYQKMERINQERRASLSWHLTKREKESIFRTIDEDYNQKELQKLQQLLSK